MDDKARAARIVQVARGCVVFEGAIPEPEIEYALQMGWIVPLGIGMFEITEAVTTVASR